MSKKSWRGLSPGFRGFLLLILILSVAVFASRMVTYRQLISEQDALREQKEAYEQEIIRAEYYLGDSIDYDDIVRIAREKFNLAFPDDTIIYTGQGAQP